MEVNNAFNGSLIQSAFNLKTYDGTIFTNSEQSNTLLWSWYLRQAKLIDQNSILQQKNVIHEWLLY
jgi:hypothetical protein